PELALHLLDRLAGLVGNDVANGRLEERIRDLCERHGPTLVPRLVVPPSFWVASTKPEAALARGQGLKPWQERGWALAPRDRGPEAGMYCWMGHYGTS